MVRNPSPMEQSPMKDRSDSQLICTGLIHSRFIRFDTGFRSGFRGIRRFRRCGRLTGCIFRDRSRRFFFRAGQHERIVSGTVPAGNPDAGQVQPDRQPQAGHLGIGIGAPADMPVMADEAELVVGRVFDGDTPPGAFPVGPLHIQAF